jgi:hypothetical protein
VQLFIFPLQLDKMENFSSSWLKQNIWNLFYTVIILPCVCIQMVNDISTVL